MNGLKADSKNYNRRMLGDNSRVGPNSRDMLLDRLYNFFRRKVLVVMFSDAKIGETAGKWRVDMTREIREMTMDEFKSLKQGEGKLLDGMHACSERLAVWKFKMLIR
jgi:hypothetical protein